MSIDLRLGDCLEVMADLPAGSIDLILTDLPYGVTSCRWDSVIPFEPLWAHYKRLLKPRGAVVLTASQPFTSALVMSNPKWFRYCQVWEKTLATNFMWAKKIPQKKHEDIAVFYAKQPTYNPQMQPGSPYAEGRTDRRSGQEPCGVTTSRAAIANVGTRYPSSVIRFSNSNHGLVHPTQKPVPLMEYLVKTYSNEGETVLDSCMGSGTTGVACLNTGRNFIGIEKDPGYFAIAQQRTSETLVLVG